MNQEITQKHTVSTAINDRFIRWKELKTIVPLSRDRIRVLENEGRFPKRRKLGTNSIAWLESEVLEWLNTRV